MKIARVSTTAVRVPIPPGSYASDSAGTKREWGRLSRLSPKRPTHMLEYVLVHIETDDGHECARGITKFSAGDILHTGKKRY